MSSRRFSDKKHIQDARAFLREAKEGNLTRRDLLKLGVFSGAGAMVGLAIPRLRAQVSDLDFPPSPFVTPFIAPLRIPPVLQPVSQTALSGAALGGRPPNPNAHQYYRRFLPARFYYLEVRQVPHSFHPELPAFPVWTYNPPGQTTVPSPTIRARYGQPIVVRYANRLPAQTTGFGLNQMITHLHNFHTASESDGGPWGFYGPGGFKDHHYTMARAGFTVPQTIPRQFRDASGGDVRETLTTLWYHDHRPDFTSPNIYRGRLGYFTAFDELDTGNETTGYRLPSGRFDVSLMVQDRRFDPRTGELVFDQFELDGFLGDKYSVNGTVQPFMNVARRKYRLRLLNPGPARWYQFALYVNGSLLPFTQITEDGNFLERPRRNITRVEVQPGTRVDIVVDFRQVTEGTEVFLANVLPMEDGRQPERDEQLNPANVNNQIMKFTVGATVADPSRIPDAFRPFPPINLSEVADTKLWDFDRTNGQWAINNQLFDPEIDHLPQRLANPRNPVRRNTAELWTLENHSGGWAHPIHNHFEEGQIYRVDGRALPPEQQARLDVYSLDPKFNAEIVLFQRFRDFPDPDFRPSAPPGIKGRYVIHCHNTTHEDHSMMQTWNVVNPTTT